MPDWLDYQKLAASIYRDLEQNAVVTHDDRITGRNSGIERQIDVSIRSNVAGHELLIIVQAKHLSRPADVNVVGEFKSVVDDVRASKGVLICSSGFTGSAIEYGNSVGIDLCTAHDAQSRQWALDLRIPLLWIEETADVSLDMDLVPDHTNQEEIRLRPNAGTWAISGTESGATTTIADLLCSAWNRGELVRTADQSHEYVVDQPGLRVLLGDSFWCPLKSLTYRYRIRHKSWGGTFTFSQCRGIVNRSTGVLRARLTMTDRDMPFERNPEWQVIDDLVAFEAKNQNLLRIMKSTIAPDCFTFDVFAIGEP